MTGNNPPMRLTKFQEFFSDWNFKDIAVAAMNFALLLILAVCGITVVQAIRSGEYALNDLIYIGIIAVLAYVYHYGFAFVSVKFVEKKTGNISKIVRLASILYYVGTCFMYFFVIGRMGSDIDRFFIYITTLILCIAASFAFGQLLKNGDVFFGALSMLGFNVIHLAFMASQYAMRNSNYDVQYFLANLVILLGVAFTYIYILSVGIRQRRAIASKD